MDEGEEGLGINFIEVIGYEEERKKLKFRRKEGICTLRILCSIFSVMSQIVEFGGF
jgi:hypothetical protein